MLYQFRKRTKLEDIVSSFHLCFGDISLRNTSKALSKFVHRSHHTTAIRVDWIQKYLPKRLSYGNTKIAESIIEMKLNLGLVLMNLFGYDRLL